MMGNTLPYVVNTEAETDQAFAKELLVGKSEQALLFPPRDFTSQCSAIYRCRRLRWRGPTAFAEFATKLGEPCLTARANAVAAKLTQSNSNHPVS